MQEYRIEEETGRIDTCLANLLGYSRSKIAKMLKDNAILVNDTPVKASYQLKKGDIIKVGEYVEEEMSAEPEKWN